MPVIDTCSAQRVEQSFRDLDQCKLVATCQERRDTNVQLAPEIEAACKKALADYQVWAKNRQAAKAKAHDDEIKALSKK